MPTDGQETLTVTPETAPSAELTGEILSQLVYGSPIVHRGCGWQVNPHGSWSQRRCR